MDWNDSETIRMLESIGELESELAAANARIAELERCCVVGCDGKPKELHRDRNPLHKAKKEIHSVKKLT